MTARVLSFLSTSPTILYLFYLVISIFLPMVWFGEYLLYSEQAHILNPLILWDEYTGAWNENLNYGIRRDFGTYYSIYPAGMIAGLLNFFSFPNASMQMIIIQILIFLILLSIHKFITLFTKNKIVILICVLYYTFGFRLYASVGHLSKLILLILVPLFFYLTYRYLETKKSKYIIINFLAVFTFLGIFTNPPLAIVTYGIYVVAFLYYATSKKFEKSIFKDLLVFIVPIVPLLYFVYISYFNIFFSSPIDFLGAASNFWKTATPDLYKVFQFRGAWYEYGGSAGIPYVSWIGFYDNFVVVFISLFIFLASVSIQFFNGNRKTLFFIAFLLVALSLLYDPIHSFLYNHVEYYRIFREPWDKFIILVMLPTVALFAMFLNYAFLKIGNRYKQLLFVLFMLTIVLIKSYPFMTPNLINKVSQGWHKPLAKVPDYWYEFLDWSQDYSQYNLLTFPYVGKNTPSRYEYTWYDGLGDTNAPMPHIFSYFNTVGTSKSMNSFSNNVMFKLEPSEYIKIAPIDYILIDHDIHSKEILDMKILDFFNCDVEKNIFGSLQICPVKQSAKINTFEIPEKTVFMDTNLSAISANLNKKYAYIKPKNMDNEVKKNVHNQVKCQIDYVRYNSMEYSVTLSKCSGKGYVPLVFYQNYDPKWAINGLANLTAYHTMANGFANYWLVPVTETDQTMKIQYNEYSFDTNVLFWFSFASLVLAVLINKKRPDELV